MSEEGECEAFFSLGHEKLPPTHKTDEELHGERRAWFSDIEEAEHGMRVEEERAFLLEKDKLYTFTQKTPSKSSFPHPERTQPIGISPSMACAIEYVRLKDADEVRDEYRRLQKIELNHYYREMLGRAKTREHVIRIGGQISTRAKIEYDPELHDYLMVDMMATVMERLQDESLVDEADPSVVEDPMGKHIEVPDSARPVHTLSHIAMTSAKKRTKKEKVKGKGKAKNKKNKGAPTRDSTVGKVPFKVLICPTPMGKTTVKTSNKRCTWKPLTLASEVPTGIFYCDPDSKPLLHLMGDFLQLAFILDGNVRVLVIKTTSASSPRIIYNHTIPTNDVPRHTFYDPVTDTSVVATYNYAIMVRNRQKQGNKTLSWMVGLTYKDDPIKEESEEDILAKKLRFVPCISAISYTHEELRLGTYRGEALTFNNAYLVGDSENAAIGYHTSNSSAPIKSIHRSGYRLYATNIMDTIGVEKPISAMFARGIKVCQSGSVHQMDHVLGVDSCGTLLASLNKSGVLQVQTTELCPHPEDPTKYMDSRVFHTVDYTTYAQEARETYGILAPYQAVMLGRTYIYCLYPNGKIQMVFMVPR